MYNKYSEQAIRNFVSGKGSVMTEEGKRKAQKDKSAKISLWLILAMCLFFSVSNAVQWNDVVVRCIFAAQMSITGIWMVISKFCFGVTLYSAAAPQSKVYQIISIGFLLIIIDLMFIGGFRGLYRGINILMLVIIVFLQIVISFIFERKRILSAIEDNDGIKKRPFENERDISEGLEYIVFSIIFLLAIRGHITIFSVIIIILETYTTIWLSRSLIEHIYKLYFANKYDMRDELFKNIL